MLFVKLMFVIGMAAGVVVLAHVRKRSADNVTVEELVGEWYTIATANAASDPGSLTCDRKNITKVQDDDKCIHVSGSALWNGSSFSYDGKGGVSGSTWKMEYPALNITTTFQLKSFNNGAEIILEDKGDGKHHTLLSRKPTISSETKEKFEKKAKDDKVKVTDMSQDNCS